MENQGKTFDEIYADFELKTPQKSFAKAVVFYGSIFNQELVGKFSMNSIGFELQFSVENGVANCAEFPSKNRFRIAWILSEMRKPRWPVIFCLN